jgi:hypothetical protein
MRARRPALVPAIVLIAGAAIASANAQELAVSAGAGGFFPMGSAYRAIYGGGTAIAGDVWLRLKGGLGFAAGFGGVSDKGVAVPTAGGTEVYPLEFRRTTIPLIAFYEIKAGPAAIRLGAGLGFHRYRETWTTADRDYEGNKTAPRFMAAVFVKVAGRISVFCSAASESIRTGEGTSLEANVNLGGLQVLGGLAVRIF